MKHTCRQVGTKGDENVIASRRPSNLKGEIPRSARNDRGGYFQVKQAYLTLVFVLILSCNVFAKEVPYTLEDRDRLIRVETEIREMNKRFEQRFEQIDKRFEDFNKRFESLEKQIDRLAMIFTALVVCVIGFAIWDRKTMIRPFEDKVKVIETRLDANEKAIKEIDPSKINNLIDALKDLAKTDTKIEGVLKRFNLL